MSRRLRTGLIVGGLVAVGLLLWNSYLSRLRQEQALRDAEGLLVQGELDQAEALLAPYLTELRAVHLQALILEARDDAAGCRALLEPRAAALGSGEGARVLGLLWLRAGDTERAAPLLRGYLDHHIARLITVREKLAAARTIERDRLLAPGGLPEAERAALLADSLALAAEVSRRVAAQPLLEPLRAELRGERVLVGISVELASAQVRAAADEAGTGRLQALNEARRTLLEVAPLAETTRSWLLVFGQVSYWLGDTANGAGAFETLLSAYPDDQALHFRLARLVQRLGEWNWAVGLYERVWERAEDEALRAQAALARAQASRSGVEEKITWLTRADAEDPAVRAALAMARGEQAERAGEREEAGRLYGLALEASRAQDPEVGRNNQALALLALVRLRPDPAKLAEAIGLFEQAIAAQPREVTVLRNAAVKLFEVGLSEQLAPLLPPGLVVVPRLEDLAFLYDDAAERAQLLEVLGASPALRRASELFARLRDLSPADPVAYKDAALLATLGELPALEACAEALSRTVLDLEAEAEQLAALYRGEPPPAWLAVLAQRAALLEGGLVGPLSALQRSYVAGSLVGVRLTGSQLGEDPAPDALVALAESAHAARPSAGSRRALLRALLFRCADRLGAAELERLLGAGPALAWLATHRPAERERMRADPDLLAALALLREQRAVFAGDARLWEWGLLAALDLAEADDVAASLRADRAGTLLERVDAELAPDRISTRLHAYWRALLDGDAEEARAIVEGARAEGIPLPELVE